MSSFGIASSNPWVQVLDALEKKVNRTSYETWFKPTRYDHAQGPILFVRVPNPDFCHIGERYGDLISEAIENLGLDFRDVEFVTEDEPSKPKSNGGVDVARGRGATLRKESSRAGHAATIRLGRSRATESEVHL